MEDTQFSIYIRHWSRYIDDIPCIWSGPVSGIQLLFESTNSLDPVIEFVHEMRWNIINFLDLHITLIARSNT